jgi:methyl-accepting chemotaxis protein
MPVAAGAEQVAAGSHAVTSNIAGLALAVGETGGMGRQVLGAATELSRRGEWLQIEVEEFPSTTILAA